MPSATEAEEEPKKKSRKKRLPKVLPGGEVRALLDASDDGTARGTRDRLMLELMYRAGLRVSEVTKLKPRDVEADGVVRLYDAKGGDGTAYFDAERLNPMIDRWLAIRAGWTSDPAAPLFVRPDGKKVSVRYIQRLVTRLKERCQIRGKCTPHVLRHTMATEMLEEGFTLTEVQGALRHANLQTTAVYLHLRDEQLRRKISRRSSGGGDT